MMGFVASEVVSHPLLLLGILTVVPLLIVLLGILPLRQSKAASAVITEILAHAFAWAAILFGLFFWIPRMRKAFEDFDAELPEYTIWLIRLSDISVRFWFVILVLLLGIVIVDGYVLFMLWKRDAKSSIRTSWSLLMTSIPLFAVTLGEAAIFFPLLKLFNDLS